MKILTIILSTILVFGLSSCAIKPSPNIQEKIVYKKCEIPDIPPAKLESINKDDPYPEKLRKLIYNYSVLLEENFLLRSAIDICR